MSASEEKYQQYVQKKQAQWHPPADCLQALFRKATGTGATRFDRVVKGGANEVYFASTPAGDELVVRILREQRDGVPGGGAEEAWCLDMCRKAGLPVPEVVALDTIQVEGQTLDALLLTKLRGAPFSEHIPGLSPKQIDTGYRRMGEALSRLHAIQVGGYYRRAPEDGVWDYPDWDASCKDAYQSRSADAPHLQKAGFSAADIDRALGCIGRYAEELRGHPPVLCHGDFGPEHVFFDDALALSGVIDFGSYAGDHPVGDFAYISMELGDGVRDAIGAGYGPAYDEQFVRGVKLRKTITLIGYLAHHIQIPGHPSTPGYIAGLRKALAGI